MNILPHASNTPDYTPWLMIEKFTGLWDSEDLKYTRQLLEARSYQDLHCLSFNASLCDTDTNIHFFREFFFHNFCDIFI